jgi:hypothetical protein
VGTLASLNLQLSTDTNTSYSFPMGAELQATLIQLDVSGQVMAIISDMVCYEKSAQEIAKWDGLLLEMEFTLNEVH